MDSAVVLVGSHRTITEPLSIDRARTLYIDTVLLHFAVIFSSLCNVLENIFTQCEAHLAKCCDVCRANVIPPALCLALGDYMEYPLEVIIGIR